MPLGLVSPRAREGGLAALQLLEEGGGGPRPTPWRRLCPAPASTPVPGSPSHYGSLRHHWHQPGSALATAVAWLTETQPFSLLVFDEAHVAKTPRTSTFQSICELQDRLPQCGVLYCTATAASDVGRIGYMKRLGLFGDTSRGDPFASYLQCRNALSRGGMTALELVALHLKSRGLYVSRALMPTEEVCSQPLAVGLSARQVGLYDACCGRWGDRFRQVHQAAPGFPPPEPVKNLVSLRQNFFLRLLAAFKAEAVVEHVRRAVAEGWSVVVSFQSTGTGESNGCLDIARHAEVSTEGLSLPPDALDVLVWGLHGSPGVGPVAEITGRKVRRDPGGAVAKRTRATVEAEKEAFQRDEIRVALLSAKGGTAISLHALPGHRRRLHLLLELPWSAEALEQQCGRTHRTNEASPPLYRVVTTDVPVDKRVAQVVARRMHHLGALSRGDHRHHQDHTHSADSLVSATAMRRAALEVMMRESHGILEEEGRLPEVQVPRFRAREILEVGDGFHHDSLCRAACKCLSQCLSSVDISALLAEDPEDPEEARQRLRDRLRQLKEARAAVETLLPSRCYSGASQRWSFRGHPHFPGESRRVALTVVLCARRRRRESLGRLPKELLECIIAEVLDDGWTVPPGEVMTSLRCAGISRETLCHAEPHVLMGRLCAVPVVVQLTLWSAMRRAIEAEGQASSERREADVAPRSPGAVDIARFCHPTGVPKGCELVCSDFATPSPARVVVTLDLVPLPGGTLRGEAAIEEALRQPNPIGGGLLDEAPRVYWSRGTYTLRVVVPKRHSRHDAGAWDLEIFSPGCIEPVARLTAEKWPEYFHAKMALLSGSLLGSDDPEAQRHLLRRAWEREAEVRVEQRARKCRERRHVVKIITAEAALHKWETTSKVLIKAEPPLTPVPVIGVAA